MGFPVSAEILLPNGMRQQAFERGAISYNPATLVATLQPPVTSLTISAGSSLQMYPGGASPVQASLAAAGGVAVAGRPVVWSSSNTKVVQIQGSGASVVLYAVASGSATVTATAEGTEQPAERSRDVVLLLRDWTGRAYGRHSTGFSGRDFPG